MMAKILIIGCGAIGYELAKALAEAGHEVVGLKRNPPAINYDKLSYFRGDITIAQDLQALPTDFEHIYFIVSADSRNEDSYHDIYETGLSNLLDKFARAGSDAPWIFVSSTSVYAQSQGEWVDEGSVTAPNKSTSCKILAAERKLTAHNPNNIIVRFSGIYGPGREYLLRMAQKTPSIQKVPPYYTNRIHQRDCVGILAFLLAQRLAGVGLQSCYLASDDNPAPLWEVISWLTKKMSCQPPLPLDRSSDVDCDLNKRCRNDRIKKLGYAFLYPDYKNGYGELLNLPRETGAN